MSTTTAAENEPATKEAAPPPKDVPGTRSFRCDICPVRAKRNFSTQFSLDIHIRHVHKGEPIACQVCHRQFKNTEILVTHMLRHSDDRPFSCTLCEGRFKSRGALREHYKLHKGLRYKCSLCAKDFRLLASCKMHEQKHLSKATGLNADKTGLRFKCEHCGKMFNQRCVLTAHMRTHTGERPYVCPDCGRAFADKTNMSKHMRIHTGVRPFRCDECGKTFMQNSALTHHRRSHVTYKPHACEKCGKMFVTKEEVIGHRRKVHGENILYQCSFCEQEFDEHAHLKSHMKLHVDTEMFMKKKWVIKEDVDLNDDSIYLKNGEICKPRVVKRKRKSRKAQREEEELQQRTIAATEKSGDSSDDWRNEDESGGRFEVVEKNEVESDGQPSNEDHFNDAADDCTVVAKKTDLIEIKEEIGEQCSPPKESSFLGSFLQRFKTQFKDDPIVQNFDFASTNSFKEEFVSYGFEYLIKYKFLLVAGIRTCTTHSKFIYIRCDLLYNENVYDNF